MGKGKKGKKRKDDHPVFRLHIVGEYGEHGINVFPVGDERVRYHVLFEGDDTQALTKAHDAVGAPCRFDVERKQEAVSLAIKIVRQFLKGMLSGKAKPAKRQDFQEG